MSNPTPTRAGFVTLVGRPNVGKSTLLNRALGQKLAITSARPQTTRNRIPGVLTRPDAQMIFVDTPGLHDARRALNSYMVEIATEALWDTDAIALLVEAGVGPNMEVGISATIQTLLDQLKVRGGAPVYLIINKIDQVERAHLLPIIDAYRKAYAFTEIVPISALHGEGVDHLLDLFARAMPAGPLLYPPDALTDLPERFIAAEMVREKLFRLLGQEVPYSVGVTVEEWSDRAQEGRVDIAAVIHVERDSQKAIVIGRGGSMVKKVGTLARRDLEQLLGARVNLKLFVRVERGWTRSAGGLRKLGYEK